MIYGVGCMDQNYGIGHQNHLPEWKLPLDMERFRKITLEKNIVMGRKTFDSLGNTPLRDRKSHIVITRHPNKYINDDPSVRFMTFTDWIQYSSSVDEDFYIIGGSQLWKECYSYIDYFYLSYTNDCYPCDTFFDVFSWNDWYIEKIEHFHNYKYFILKKKRDDILCPHK